MQILSSHVSAHHDLPPQFTFEPLQFVKKLFTLFESLHIVSPRRITDGAEPILSPVTARHQWCEDH